MQYNIIETIYQQGRIVFTICPYRTLLTYTFIPPLDFVYLHSMHAVSARCFYLAFNMGKVYYYYEYMSDDYVYMNSRLSVNEK